MTSPRSGQGLPELPGIVGAKQPLVDEALNATLDLPIESGQLAARRWVKFNGPSQAASSLQTREYSLHASAHGV